MNSGVVLAVELLVEVVLLTLEVVLEVTLDVLVVVSEVLEVLEPVEFKPPSVA